MSRLRSGLLAMVCAPSVIAGFASCEEEGGAYTPRGYGSYYVDAGEGASLATRAEAAFRLVEPDLLRLCGKSCHGDQSNGPYPWLKGPDPYLAIKAFPGAVTEDPYQSKIYLRGAHAGPALDGPNKAVGDGVIRWLVLEAEILKSKAIPTTDAFDLVIGANTQDVSKAGVGVSGTKVTWNATRSGNIITFSKLTLVAPAGTGVRAKHPIFYVVPKGKDKVQDPVDSLSIVDMKVPAGKSAQMGTGTMFLFDWADTNKLAIGFEKLEVAAIEDAGTGGGGCKSAATYVTSAVPAIQANTCLSCHAGQSPQATGALDMQKVNKDNTAACAQALTQVNRANKPLSNIIVAPTGGGTHPYQVPAAGKQGYIDAMLGWINNE